MGKVFFVEKRVLCLALLVFILLFQNMHKYRQQKKCYLCQQNQIGHIMISHLFKESTPQTLEWEHARNVLPLLYKKSFSPLKAQSQFSSSSWFYSSLMTLRPEKPEPIRGHICKRLQNDYARVLCTCCERAVSNVPLRWRMCFVWLVGGLLCLSLKHWTCFNVWVLKGFLTWVPLQQVSFSCSFSYSH